MKRITIILIVLLITLSLSAEENDWKFKEIRFTTSDGLTLVAWFGNPQDIWQTQTLPRPLILLLPMMSQTHESYDPFLAALSDYTKKNTIARAQPLPYILAFDLRGHGKSTQWKDSSLSFQTMTPNDFTRMPTDVVEMTRTLLKDKQYAIDTGNIVIIGASIGANAAIMATKSLENVAKVVMLSPGQDYRSLKPEQALGNFKGKSLIFASNSDTYAASSSRKLAGVAKQCELWMFEGEDHGTNIINNDPDVMKDLLGWLYGE